MFTCTVHGKEYRMALIHAYDAPKGTRNAQRDRELRFTRIRERPRDGSEFIFVDSIVRGALIADDYDSPKDHLVINFVDSDLWLRMKEMRL